MGEARPRGHYFRAGAFCADGIRTRRTQMDVELWAALSGYDVTLRQAYRRRQLSATPHRPSGRIFGEMMPQTFEDVRLFCYRVSPAVDRALANWLPLDEGVANALVRIKRLIRFVLEQSNGALPGIPLVYEELNLE